MKLVVGLGNPGKVYENTRHNIGFLIIDKYLKYKKCEFAWTKKFNGVYCQCKLFNENIIFLKPQSFMNLSGEVVKKFVDYFKIDINDILIISDDLDLNIGNFKLKNRGSSGGHNGLKDIEHNLQTSEYKRLKIGISNNKNIETKDYVLGKFSTEEKNKLEELFSVIEKVLDDYFKLPFDQLMNKYNQKNR